jgi:hypothetical protein
MSTVHGDQYTFLIIPLSVLLKMRNVSNKFDVQGSVHRKYSFDIFPTRCIMTQFIYFCKTALHVSGGISTHHQQHTQLYLQYPLQFDMYQIL